MDYLELSHEERRLTVYFLADAPQNLEKENVIIEGGADVQGIKVVDLRLCSAENPDQDDCMYVFLDKTGDLSTYTLKLVEIDDDGNATDTPLFGFDPLYAQLDFEFRAAVASDLDCQTSSVCPPPQFGSPDFSYLAKDYASFRQLILDRLALTVPEWQETHIADENMALVEVLAFVGDYLSYYQDAVATEAYLNTARQRISIRRHARLLDYAMHEGCNARAWVVVNPTQDPGPMNPADIFFIAGYQGAANQGEALTLNSLHTAPLGSYVVFKPVMADMPNLLTAHNEIRFYTWGNRQCCLPAGATSATLEDGWKTAPDNQQKQQAAQATSRKRKSPSNPDLKESHAENSTGNSPDTRPRNLELKSGDMLLLEEVKGAETGVDADADSKHRQVVQLTKVTRVLDPLTEKPVLLVEWASEDALTFPLCISTVTRAPECQYVENISVARGNVLLADHGVWLCADHPPNPKEVLGTVPLATSLQTCESANQASNLELTAGRFRPRLKNSGLTFQQPPDWSVAAAHSLVQDPRLALPQISLISIAPLPDGSGPLFSFTELEAPWKCATRLASSKDDATKYLRERLTRATLEALDHFDPDIPKTVPPSLANELKQFVREWQPRPDLLSSQPDDYHFVVEMDNNGIAHLRFGSGNMGRAVEPGETFAADYRLGNGVSGNLGSEAISRVAFRSLLAGVSFDISNPLPAQGGINPESINEVKLFAPGTFLNKLERAITADDYAMLAANNPRVQRAAATLLWTGTRYEAHVAIDPLGTDVVPEDLLEQVRSDLEAYRRIGHDLVVVPATYIPLDVAISVHVCPDYLRAHVKQALLDVFGDGVLADGRRGVFHPDNLSFGDNIYASQLIAAAQVVPGVASVTLAKLERLYGESNQELEKGVLSIGPLEIAQLDNDPRHPERGRLLLTLRGGR